MEKAFVKGSYSCSKGTSFWDGRRGLVLAARDRKVPWCVLHCFLVGVLGGPMEQGVLGPSSIQEMLQRGCLRIRELDGRGQCSRSLGVLSTAEGVCSSTASRSQGPGWLPPTPRNMPSGERKHFWHQLQVVHLLCLQCTGLSFFPWGNISPDRQILGDFNLHLCIDL